MKILEYLINLYKKNKEVINYLIFGFFTTVINLVVYYLLTFIFLNANDAVELQIANIISWIISVLFAYVTNRKFVFESKEKEVLKEAKKFFFSRILTLVLDMVIMFVGVSLLKQNDKVLKIISQILVIVSNYILSKLFVFKK